MKKITLSNYRDDKYYQRVVAAVAVLLEHDTVVRPIEVFAQMGILDKRDVTRWRLRQVPYLEKVVACNLEKASRILRILRLHAHDLNLKPSFTHYKAKGATLRFTKSGDPNLEEAYSNHFVRVVAHKNALNRRQYESIR